MGNIREHVELHPFQYRYFGVHLAGEGFYDRLDSLRSDVRANLDVLEVYHLCLALGFEGKYSLENRDQLRYIANTLGQDIARYRQQSDERNESWKLPDQVGQLLRYEIPLWVYLLGIVLVCLIVYGGLRWWLGSETDSLIEQIRQLFNSTR
ncbi:DotU family type IV/VI secretion system protein [Salinicola acroporae]|uniref:DotU family type IV/VI secretion system protein n=1 Tax=Salinicola acroporae TaxID=1541440 RepID=UPI002455F7F7